MNRRCRWRPVTSPTNALRSVLLPLLLPVLLIVWACTPTPKPEPATQPQFENQQQQSAASPISAPAKIEVPGADSYIAAALNKPVYEVDGLKSLVTVQVGKSGPLARLGHDHIVSSRDLRGYVLADAKNDLCSADLIMPVATLEVDNAVLRIKAGLDTTPTAEDIAGTRANMLNFVLNPVEHPAIALNIKNCTPLQSDRFSIALEINGMEKSQAVAVERFELTDSYLALKVKFSILQSDFGITPFQALGGMLKVEDALDITVAMEAHRIVLMPHPRRKSK